MSNLKTLFHEFHFQDTYVQTMDAVSRHPDGLKAYVIAELELLSTTLKFDSVREKVEPAKFPSGWRTRSARWLAGSKAMKPKYNWSKKKRARKGWKV